MKKYLFLLSILLLFSCSEKAKQRSDENLIIALADDYFSKTIETHPEYAYFADIPLDNHTGISSNKLDDLKLWEEYEDSLYAKLKKVDFSQLTTRKAKITYWFLKEDLESSIAMRVCKRNLWNVDPESGWHWTILILSQVQPVGTDEFRQQAIARWEKIPGIFETEISNLKQGILQGYSMPEEIVNLVIGQLYSILNYDITESPLMLPAIKDGNKEFYSQWEDLITESILPTFENYHNYLENEYLPDARDNVSILALPNGKKCYQAYIRKFTTTNKTGNEIFETGKKNVLKNNLEIEEFGKELYNTENFDEIIKRINNDTSNYFYSSEDILATSELLMNKARKESTNWFAKLPATEVAIKPYEEHETGSGAYEASAGDKPPYFRISLNNPEKQQKGKNEVLVFHETYPGHHIQIGLEKEIGDLHPIVKLISFTSYVEGWARYCEQFAEEINLYESKSALITRRAWPSRGMVIDPGIHIKAWTKKQALEYMTESGMSEEMALNLYYRSITMPAQLTSYDVGGEEIKALRSLAEKELGNDFEIKEFHSKILENGAIPLSALRIIIEEWIEGKLK